MKKLNFEELSSSMNIVDDPTELARLMGGTDPIINITGGYITNGAGGATFTNYSGQSLYLPGVQVSNNENMYNSNYQLNGTIHLDPDSGADINTLVHEYGHYLQQQNMGNYTYYTQVALPSMYSASEDTYEEHMARPYEYAASMLGDNFVKYSNPYFYNYQMGHDY